MRVVNAPKLIVDALLQRFLLLARRRVDTAQAQVGFSEGGTTAQWGTPSDASTFQRKLAVECIFCSACIQIVECCPAEGLTEALWGGLEKFAFDWLINADRVVSHAEYPSLIDLRGLLLDLVAQLLGALSRLRFNSITEQYFTELDKWRSETVRSETLSIIHGIRYLKLEVGNNKKDDIGRKK